MIFATEYPGAISTRGMSGFNRLGLLGVTGKQGYNRGFAVAKRGFPGTMNPESCTAMRIRAGNIRVGTHPVIFMGNPLLGWSTLR